MGNDRTINSDDKKAQILNIERVCAAFGVTITELYKMYQSFDQCRLAELSAVNTLNRLQSQFDQRLFRCWTYIGLNTIRADIHLLKEMEEHHVQ